MSLSRQAVEDLLCQRFGTGVELIATGPMGGDGELTQGMKGLGYGTPVLVRYRVDGREAEAVLSTMRGDHFGHQFWWDRAHVLAAQYTDAFHMDRHAPPLALAWSGGDGGLHLLQDVQEFALMTERVPGSDYYHDLYRIADGDLREADREQVREFARWLAQLHATKHPDKQDEAPLYRRRMRELIGASECIFGIIDEAWDHPCAFFTPADFAALEKRLVDWRWKLSGYTHRLCDVHGDFHPWNVLVDADDPQAFRVLDRSRGRWGDGASDVAGMAINFLLFGLRTAADEGREPVLDGPFSTLWDDFFAAYLQATGDDELAEVLNPFFVFRALVVASPRWYPDHPDAVRRALLAFVRNVAEAERFDHTAVDGYLR